MTYMSFSSCGTASALLHEDVNPGESFLRRAMLSEPLPPSLSCPDCPAAHCTDTSALRLLP